MSVVTHFTITVDIVGAVTNGVSVTLTYTGSYGGTNPAITASGTCQFTTLVIGNFPLSVAPVLAGYSFAQTGGPTQPIGTAGNYTITYTATALPPKWYIALQNNQGDLPSTSPDQWQEIAEPVLSDGLMSVRDYCTANNIFASLKLDSQRPAKEILTDLCMIANCKPVWNGQTLDFYPLSEVATAGGGAVYTPPTVNGPITVINDKWFVVDGAEAPVKIVQQNMQAVYNTVDIMYSDKHGTDPGWVGTTKYGYNQTNVTICDQQHAFTYGTQFGSPQSFDDYLIDANTAALVGWPIMKRQRFMDPYHFQFKLPVNFSLLDPMDLITIDEPFLLGGTTINNGTVTYTQGGSGTADVRIVSMSESKGVWQIEAERFLFGCHAPQAPSVTYATPPTPPNSTAPAGSVNAPYFFQPTPSLATALGMTGGNPLCIAVSGSAANYGGCLVNVSTDGGNSYQLVGSVSGNPNMGVIYNTTYPLANSPDTVHTLYVNLTESDGTLQSWTAAQQNLLNSTAVLQGGSTEVPYEVVSYGIVTLGASYEYSLSPPILRGVQGTTPASHPTGSYFVDLSNSAAVFKFNIPSSVFVGETLYLKFQTINSYHTALQDLADCTAYTYVPLPPVTTGDININEAISGSTYVVEINGTADGGTAVGIEINGQPG